MAKASVRYIVNNVDESIPFYEQLGFLVDMHPAPPFARLVRDDLYLMLNQPGAGGAGQSGNDGAVPAPGGWNRFQLEVANLDATVAELKEAGRNFRTDIVQGNGGRQAVVEDPSGNAVELFEPPNDRG
jgi:catechol 2,3-dioxygenase-like lactoylglutathione lyase family enzyme